jgi:hypothetical protein
MKEEKTTDFPFMVKEIVIRIDWNLVPTGTRFKATLDSKEAEGLIYNGMGKEGETDNIYFCQNSINGNNAANKLGYKHSWALSRSADSIDSMESNGVKNLEFFPIPDGFVAPIMPKIWEEDVAGYRPIVNIGYVKFGCQKVPNNQIRKLAEALIDDEKVKT